MENVSAETKINSNAIERFKDFTSFKNSRKVIMKIYFAAEEQKILSSQDKEEVYFLYNLLEDLQ